MPRFSLVLPTFNEVENIEKTVADLLSLNVPSLEIWIVDGGSNDGTRAAAEHLQNVNPKTVHALCFSKRTSLSASVTAGFDAAKGDILICMDADGQHRPEDLPRLLKNFDRPCDLAIGSRYAEGGGFAEPWNWFRILASRTAAFLAHVVLRVRTGDPMSGFFAVRGECYRKIRPELLPDGFKIMLEILYRLTSGRDAVVRETGIVFDMRKHGRSKLSGNVMLQYLAMLIRCRFSNRSTGNAPTHIPPE